ncbi:MAG: adenosylmethionine-8-amino-7-oxononanoate aminotransferase [Kiritimatiellia bacterium]|jgi:adenosylmethionine-8-amino-7-oxononanoate aminotransferase
MSLADLDKQVLWHPFTPQHRWVDSAPLVIEHADGCMLYDIDGNEYIDGVSSLWTNVHGHRHPKLDQAIRDQLDKMAHSTMLGLTHPTAIQFASRLVDVTPAGLSRVFYSDSGSTATEIAVKMAFQTQQHRGETHRTRFATLRDAYHGDTIGAVSVGGIDAFHAIFRPLLFPTTALPAPVQPGGEEERECLRIALDLLEREAHTLAALIVEPLVQGAAGMKMHTTAYLEPLLKRARQLGVLVIADEVAVGFGRTGTLFAMEQVDFVPDFLCLAKGISGGYLPLAATLATEAVYEAFLGAPEDNRQFFHGHTYTGNPLACAVALASLQIFYDDHVLDNVAARAAQLSTSLADLRRSPSVRATRHKGVMAAIDLRDPTGSDLPPDTGHKVSMAARRHGVILRPLGNTLVINPPLSIDAAHLDRLMQCTRAAIQDVLPA